MEQGLEVKVQELEEVGVIVKLPLFKKKGV